MSLGYPVRSELESFRLGVEMNVFKEVSESARKRKGKRLVLTPDHDILQYPTHADQPLSDHERQGSKLTVEFHAVADDPKSSVVRKQLMAPRKDFLKVREVLLD